MMEFRRFLDTEDAGRATRALRKLAACDISRWALTGGLAVEIHILQHGRESGGRQLRDMDFVAASFEDIPAALGSEVLFRHVHPYDKPAKTMLQCVDEETALRVDLLRAYGQEMERAVPVRVDGIELKMISVEDVEAAHARVVWGLVMGKRVAPQHARDFLRLLPLMPDDGIEEIWQEHRTPGCPVSFAETIEELKKVIASRTELLAPRVYSKDVHAVCPRCHATEAFKLADSRRVFSILGYC
jgi:hypothetical protein